MTNSTQFSDKAIPEIEKLASALIGDNGEPNLFFVTAASEVVLIARDFDVAYAEWLRVNHATSGETSLEDRRTGVLASREPASEMPGATLVVIDDTCRHGFGDAPKTGAMRRYAREHGIAFTELSP